MKLNLLFQKTSLFVVGLTTILFVLTGCEPGTPPSQTSSSLDTTLRQMLAEQNIETLDIGEAPDAAKIALGEALFFDKVLSGNRDISCATCHHPTMATVDNLPLSLGTGGVGLGPDRVRGYDREFVPRNAPELFNRGAPDWNILFWDGRVSFNVETGTFRSPAGDNLPQDLDNLLAVQAMFPPTSRDEMRGGLIDVSGYGNELAAIQHAGEAQQEMLEIWAGLTARLLEHEGYQALFQAAYPDLSLDQIGFEHAANALSAYQISAFSSLESPWDRYLGGNDGAMSEAEKRGAILFYGDASCSSCHSGALMTDQSFYNIGVPQFGPGKVENGFDPGRYKLSTDFGDMTAFRTPPLRNVALTGPYMHNGAFVTLEEAVRHHLNPQESLADFSGDHLDPALHPTIKNDPVMLELISENIAPELSTPSTLSDTDINDLIAFLNALTSPQAIAGVPVPTEVPSGLPVED